LLGLESIADSTLSARPGPDRGAAIAGRVINDEDLTQAFRAFENNAILKSWVKMIGVELTLDEFLTHRDQLFLVTFDPAHDLTPPPLPIDLKWAWQSRRDVRRNLFWLAADACLEL
jgi:hypothetical protein